MYSTMGYCVVLIVVQVLILLAVLVMVMLVNFMLRWLYMYRLFTAHQGVLAIHIPRAEPEGVYSQ